MRGMRSTRKSESAVSASWLAACRLPMNAGNGEKDGAGIVGPGEQVCEGDGPVGVYDVDHALGRQVAGVWTEQGVQVGRRAKADEDERADTRPCGGRELARLVVELGPAPDGHGLVGHIVRLEETREQFGGGERVDVGRDKEERRARDAAPGAAD